MFDTIFVSFLSAIVDIEGVETNLKVEGIFCRISQKLQKVEFFCKLMKLVFFNDEFNGVYHFAKFHQNR